MVNKQSKDFYNVRNLLVYYLMFYHYLEISDKSLLFDDKYHSSNLNSNNLVSALNSFKVKNAYHYLSDIFEDFKFKYLSSGLTNSSFDNNFESMLRINGLSSYEVKQRILHLVDTSHYDYNKGFTKFETDLINKIFLQRNNDKNLLIMSPLVGYSYHKTINTFSNSNSYVYNDDKFMRNLLKSFDYLISGDFSPSFNLDMDLKFDLILMNINNGSEELSEDLKERYSEVYSYNPGMFKYFQGLLRGVELLSDDGFLIVKLPLVSPYNHEYLELNEYLVKSNIIDGVIRLPNKNATTDDKSSARLLIINKNRKESDLVYFMDLVTRSTRTYSISKNKEYEDKLINYITKSINKKNNVEGLIKFTNKDTILNNFSDLTVDVYLNNKELFIRAKTKELELANSKSKKDILTKDKQIDELINKVYQLDNYEILLKSIVL